MTRMVQWSPEEIIARFQVSTNVSRNKTFRTRCWQALQRYSFIFLARITMNSSEALVVMVDNFRTIHAHWIKKIQLHLLVPFT